MDTRPEYIKMCEKLPDEMLYGPWRGNRGDVFYSPHHKKVEVVTFTVRGEYGAPDEVYFGERGEHYVYIGDYIPLFRQDQLQEMLKTEEEKTGQTGRTSGKPWQLTDLLKHYKTWYGLYGKMYYDIFHYGTMEQVWLCIVMYEKFSKVWNSEKEDWVKA